jgi:GT2 family glycosyltransferase
MSQFERAAASIVIPTRNRAGELDDLLDSASAQSVSVEIIVCDDASEDAEAVRSTVARFPRARLLRTKAARGPSYQRNHGITAATCPVVFAPDDDSLFPSRHTVEQTLAEFNHPRVAAVGIPYANVLRGPEILQRAPDDDGIWAIHAFVGASHAVRRDAFLAVRGYREDFFYMGEEGDFCLRMLAQGWITRAGRADAIHHLESPARITTRADFHGRRNDLLFAWHNVPSSRLLLHLLGTTWNGLRAAASTGRWRSHMSGLLAGWRSILSGACHRQPVNASVYQSFRTLKKQGPRRMETILDSLPPLPSHPQSPNA